ncbi:FlxA-like family protein [Maridesulfovibrio sp.]|uniref:FlxA-like family protein n=1 Tax=Maridesulfovibrio sp. TaxID=2795000 RepID=UPI002A189CA2|nr:FlxA-like family protein [Maridesulfovibrio sp.]
MVSIDLLGGSSSTGIFNLNTVTGTTEESSNYLESQSSSGDTVEISQEAIELYKAKMAEYGASDLTELSDDQKSELKESLENLADQSGGTLSSVSESDDSAETLAGDSESTDGSGSGSAAAGASGSGSSTSSTDQIEELEEQIEELEEEIQELQSKAESDPEAADELKTKQVELAQLQAQLLQLEEEEES